MNIESKLNIPASRIMEERRGNCAQSILATYGPYLSNRKIDFDACMLTASAFGGGINLTGNVCGAITGALMALGLKYGANVQELTKISTMLIDDFTSLNGSIICRDLVGHNLFDVENLRQDFKEDIFKKCVKCVDDAARLLEKYAELEDVGKS